MRGRATVSEPIRMIHIAPCGMDCRLCVAYQRDRNPCPGCRADDGVKAKTRVGCRIKICQKKAPHKGDFCFSCASFPCSWLTHLDKRYRTKYAMSMVENLHEIHRHGVRRFVRSEKARWACPGCGAILSVHRSGCLACGYKWR